MPAVTPPTDHQLAGRILDAFEREFWAGHHDRTRLMLAPLRVLHDALTAAPDPAAVLRSVLHQLDAAARR